jgi:tetratricopeptide (TPR) repeat protein
MDRQATALLERAAALRNAGRVDEAIAAYRELLDREPDLPDSWYNLGFLQRHARQYEAALQSYDEALRRGVSEPEEVHLNRAVILSDHLASPDEAEAELEAALKLNSGYVPALLNLGNLHEDRGNRGAAEKAYRRALDVAPDDALALSRLAGVVDGKSPAAMEVVERIRRAIASAGNPGERADLGFALGRLLDARGDYDAAFEAYAAANLASRESFAPGLPGYDRDAHSRFVDRLIAAFPETARALPRSADEHATRYDQVFICGMFRSGSTLVEQVLASHSHVVAGGELDVVPMLAARIQDYPEAVGDAPEATVDQWRKLYREASSPFRRDAALLTDKRPDNFLHIGLIKTLFPDAKIVHTRRDRLDNLLSLYFLHLNPRMAYALDLQDAAHWYAEHERLMAHWKRLYPNDIFDLDYDELVRESRPTLERLLHFLGLDWEDGLLDFHRSESAVRTASVWQVREPIHARSSGRWRNYSKQIGKVLGGESD